MKIVNRKTFLDMPSGTIYNNYRPQIFGPMMMKGDTIFQMDEGSAGDFNNLNLTSEVKGYENGIDTLIHAGEKGSAFGLDFECWGRDGCFNRDQLFVVWERNDIEGLMGQLQKAMAVFPEPPSVNLFTLVENPFEIYSEFRDIWPDRDAAPEQDVISWLNDPGTEKKYLICAEGRVVGITGIWKMEPNKVALAWHGIIPSERKKGYSEAALKSIIRYAKLIFPEADCLVESIPADREDELRGFFQKLGFVRTGQEVKHPEMYDKVKWMEYVYEYF